MSCIHSIRCVPNTKREKEFFDLLDSVDVKRELLICKDHETFETTYDEYIISDGLYRIIEEDFERIRGSD